MTVLSIMVSIFVLIGVEHIRKAAKEGFEKTVSGTDLIVGARTGSVNLLLYYNSTNYACMPAGARARGHHSTLEPIAST